MSEENIKVEEQNSVPQEAEALKTDSETEAEAVKPAKTTKKGSRKKEEETVTITKSELDKVLEEISKLRGETTMLREIADKSRLARWEQQHNKKGNPIVRVPLMGTDPIIGWSKMPANRVYKNNGVWIEDQVVEVETEFGEKKQMKYSDFAKRTFVRCEVTEQTLNDEGTIYTVRVIDEDGPLDFDRTIKINSKFVN